MINTRCDPMEYKYGGTRKALKLTVNSIFPINNISYLIILCVTFKLYQSHFTLKSAYKHSDQNSFHFLQTCLSD